nr:transcriptional regulator [Microvirga lotononidis]
MVISEQIRAARALIRWEQKDLALASGVSLPTIKRLETKPGLLTAHSPTLDALERALEEAGIQFLPEGEKGGGPGVRLSYPLRNAPSIGARSSNTGSSEGS